jgi:hypothetical protein
VIHHHAAKSEVDQRHIRHPVAVAEKQAAVDVAKADLQVATSLVRGIEAQARSQRWKLQNAMEDVENRIALLHARVAALDKSKASLSLAQVEFERARQLLPTSPRPARSSTDGKQPCRLRMPELSKRWPMCNKSAVTTRTA